MKTIKILLTQTIFIPDEDKLQRSINSVKSFKNILNKNIFNIIIDINIGGWARSEILWTSFLQSIDKELLPNIKRFDRNYGKSYIVNELSKNIDNYDYMISLDSDIIFKRDSRDIIKRLINLSNKISTHLNKPFGLLSLNQEDQNCHLTDILDISLKIEDEEIKWNDKGNGIAGGCFFTSKENWIEIGGYRMGLKNYDSDDHYLFTDTLNNNRTYGMVTTLSVIHPEDKDKDYALWKLNSVSNERSICFFSSYSNNNSIDNYIKFYLENLKTYFDDVILVTNIRDINSKELQFLEKINVTIKFVENEGLDFGMWYKCFMDEDIDIFNYDKIGLINDSCILFSKDRFNKLMNWSDNSEFKYLSITESNEIDYHLQSYFLILKNQSIKLVYDYFKKYGILNKREDIIKTYEIGLTQYLKDNDIMLGSFIKNNTNKNPTIVNFDINSKMPIIKKKLLTNNFNNDEMSFLENCDFNFNTNWVDILKEITKKDTTSIEYLIENL